MKLEGLEQKMVGLIMKIGRLIYDMDKFYDDFRKIGLNKILKRAGGKTALGLSLIAIITGVSIGLKKAGNELVVVKSSKKA